MKSKFEEAVDGLMVDAETTQMQLLRLGWELALNHIKHEIRRREAVVGIKLMDILEEAGK